MKKINQELFSVLTDKKNIKRAEEIIKDESIDINATDEVGQQAIHYAAMYGLPRIIELLIEKGADVNAKAVETTPYSRKFKDWTPLHFLANSDEGANEKAALALIENGADLNSRDENNNTPLLVLGEDKIHRKLALLFIDKGADINAVDKQHDNILSKQMWKSSLDFVQELINRKINLKGKAGVNSLCQAIKHHTQDYVRLLLQQGASASSNGDYSPLSEAAYKGDWEIFTLLIEHGADLTKDKDHVLQKAIIGKGDPALQKKILDICLKQGIDFSKKNANSVNLAASFNADWAISLLAAHGADINYLDAEERTPLVHAAIRDHVKVVEALIKQGVDLSGESGLKSLLFSDDLTIANMLVKAGVNLNNTYDGYTPLQSAVDRLQFKKIKLYLENGANPNFFGKKREIPLAKAVNRVRTDVIQLLLLHGADKTIKIDKQTTIADLAAKSKKTDVATLFTMSNEELRAYQPKRPYLRFANPKLLFASGVESWNDVIKAQIKKLFGKMSLDTVKDEVGEIEYFDVINQSGKPVYQLVLFNYGDGALFAYDKTSYIGHIVQHGFDVIKKMSPEAEDELRDMLSDAYGNFEGKIRQSVDFTKC
jgi:uncharacterized protein